MVTPRHHTARSDRPTRAGAVDVLARDRGTVLMPWQRRALDVALEVDPATGLYHYSLVVITVPRQAGKTHLEGLAADHRCLTLPRARVWLTMQDGLTAGAWMRKEHFSNLGASAALRGRYRESKRAGEIGVTWPDLGSSFFAFAPTRNALHSKQSDLVFDDEAWSRTAEDGAELRQAVRPTMATRPGAQLWVVSTRGDDASEHLDGYLRMGEESLTVPGTRTAFIDYGIPDTADADDLETIAAHHPAYGRTMSRQSLEDARADFTNDPAGWARAYGNRATATRRTAFPGGVWAAAAEPVQPRPDRYGLGLDVTPDGDRFALLAGWRDVAGVGHVEVIAAGRTTRETPQLVHAAARTAAVPVTVDRSSPATLELADAAARLTPALAITYLDTATAAAACLTLYRGITGGTIRHPSDPDLDRAAEVATQRPVLDGGWLWGRKRSAGSIAELCAASWAVHGYAALPVPTRRPVAIFA